MSITHTPGSLLRESTRFVDDSDLPPSVGERNSSAVMTEDKVRAIRAAGDAGATLSALAEAFNIAPRTARHIVQRTSWRHVR